MDLLPVLGTGKCTSLTIKLIRFIINQGPKNTNIENVIDSPYKEEDKTLIIGMINEQRILELLIRSIPEISTQDNWTGNFTIYDIIKINYTNQPITNLPLIEDLRVILVNKLLLLDNIDPLLVCILSKTYDRIKGYLNDPRSNKFTAYRLLNTDENSCKTIKKEIQDTIVLSLFFCKEIIGTLSQDVCIYMLFSEML